LAACCTTISRNFPTQFARIRAAIDQHGQDQRKTEEEILGFTHENLGAYLAREWNLPVPLEIAIRFHHDFESAPEHGLDVAVVDLADRLASHLGWDFTVQRIETLEDDSAVKALELDPVTLLADLDDMRSQVVELSQHF
jgi:HD-like signal output (HDOD) protein